MGRIINIIAGLLVPLCLFSQTIDDIGKIVIGVKVMPSANTETKANKELLQNRLTNLAASAGFTSYGNNEFFITPSITVIDTQVAEGGMKTIYVTSGELYLTIQAGDSGTVFTNASFPFKGSGLTRDAAIKSGLQKISYGNLKPFFDEARGRILDYYSAIQDKLFAKAEMLAQNREYDAAIACLLSIPEELVDLYPKAYSRACELYEQRDTYEAALFAMRIEGENNEILTKARSQLSEHNASGALRTLWNYHIAKTAQDKEYKALLRKAESQITLREKAELEKARQEAEKEERRYQDNLSLKNKQIEYDYKAKSDMADALKQVALSYYNRER